MNVHETYLPIIINGLEERTVCVYVVIFSDPKVYTKKMNEALSP